VVGGRRRHAHLLRQPERGHDLLGNAPLLGERETVERAGRGLGDLGLGDREGRDFVGLGHDLAQGFHPFVEHRAILAHRLAHPLGVAHAEDHGGLDHGHGAGQLGHLAAELAALELRIHDQGDLAVGRGADQRPVGLVPSLQERLERLHGLGVLLPLIGRHLRQRELLEVAEGPLSPFREQLVLGHVAGGPTHGRQDRPAPHVLQERERLVGHHVGVLGPLVGVALHALVNKELESHHGPRLGEHPFEVLGQLLDVLADLVLLLLAELHAGDQVLDGAGQVVDVAGGGGQPGGHGLAEVVDAHQPAVGVLL